MAPRRTALLLLPLLLLLLLPLLVLLVRWARASGSTGPCASVPAQPLPPTDAEIARWTRQERMDALQAASTCWTQHGRWVLEPESFFESPRGEWSTARPCPARNHSTRLVEIGYRWIPATEPSSHERALCRAAWPYLRNRALAERMLDVLAAQSFLLVGDSMSRQFAESLDDYTSAYAPAGAAAVNVLNTTRVFNAHLLLNDRYFVGGERNRSDMYPWANLLRGPHAFGAVFLSRGNHVAPTQPMMRDYEAALAFVRTHAPNALIVVRTTVASHPGCERMVNRPPLKYPNNITFSYWADLEEQNAAVKAMVAGPAFRSHAILLDIERATAYRADAHRITVRVRPGRKPLQKYDCTHYCIPGPVDMWVEVWGNLMLLAARLGLLGGHSPALTQP